MNTSIRVAITTTNDPSVQVFEYVLPDDATPMMVDHIRRLMATRVQAEIDWMSGYNRDNDPIETMVEQNACMIERRHRMGLDQDEQ